MRFEGDWRELAGHEVVLGLCRVDGTVSAVLTSVGSVLGELRGSLALVTSDD